jgi:hypothetical protein
VVFPIELQRMSAANWPALPVGLTMKVFDYYLIIACF